MNSGKPFLVVVFFIILIALFAGGTMSNTDLTPNTPPSTDNTGGAQTVLGVQPLMGVQRVSSGVCGSVYEVRSGDTLSGIAVKCGTTLQALIAANPGISNPHFIRPGQKINLVYQVADPPSPTLAPQPQPTAAPVDAQVLPATGKPKINGLRPGGEVIVIMDGFPPDVPVLVHLSPWGGEVWSKVEAQTTTTGRLDLHVDIPVSAQPGDTWIVTVTTVRPPTMVVSAPPFKIEQ